MTSIFSYTDHTKDIYNIVHRQSRKHFEAVFYYVHKVIEMFIIMNRMLFVRVKEFSFHFFVNVYCYPVGTRKFMGSVLTTKDLGYSLFSMEDC